MEDYHPELANYEPYQPRTRSPRRLLVLRVVVIFAIAGLVLPGMITTYTYADATAQQTCTAWVDYQVPEQHTSFARFEVLGDGVLGWECYGVTADGTKHITSLGFVPGLSVDQQRELYSLKS